MIIDSILNHHIQSLTATGYYRDRRILPPFSSLSVTPKLPSQQASPMNLYSTGFALASCDPAADQRSQNSGLSVPGLSRDRSDPGKSHP